MAWPKEVSGFARPVRRGVEVQELCWWILVVFAVQSQTAVF